jgi:hypothetical protein
MQFMNRYLFISTLAVLLSCSLEQEQQITEPTLESVDSFVPDTIVPISVEQSKIANPNYDPATDPENREMYKLFEPFVSAEFLNIEQVTGNEDSIECFVNYLGTIRDLDLNTEYHVVSQFCTIQAAVTKHGNSKVAFLNRELEYARVYYLESRNQLPISTENNALIFNFSGIKKGLQIKGGLPDMLCIPDSGCYE